MLRIATFDLHDSFQPILVQFLLFISSPFSEEEKMTKNVPQAFNKRAVISHLPTCSVYCIMCMYCTRICVYIKYSTNFKKWKFNKIENAWMFLIFRPFFMIKKYANFPSN